MENQASQNPTPEPTPPSFQAPNLKPKSLIMSLVLLLLILVLLASTVFLYRQNVQFKKMLSSYQKPALPTPPTILLTPIPPQNPTLSLDSIANWKTYKNNYWKISFKYPDTMLKPCFNYFTEKEGIGFWDADFSCGVGNDILYKIGFLGYDLGKYTDTEPEKSVSGRLLLSSKTIIVDNKPAQRKTYIYEESHEILAGVKLTEVVVNLPNGTVVFQYFGDDLKEQKIFDKILSTVKFMQ